MEGFMPKDPRAQQMAQTAQEGLPVGEGQRVPVVSAPGTSGDGMQDQITIDPKVVQLLGTDFFTSLNSQNVDNIIQALGTRLKGLMNLKQQYQQKQQREAQGAPQQPQGMMQQPGGGQPAQAPQMPSPPQQAQMPNRNEHPFADQKHQGFMNGGLVRK